MLFVCVFFEFVVGLNISIVEMIAMRNVLQGVGCNTLCPISANSLCPVNVGKVNDGDRLACDNSGSVIWLNLYALMLTGTLSSEIAKLSKLTMLSFYANALHSTLPSEIALLTALSRLDVVSNNLQGTLPTQMALMNSLRYLVVFGNNFIGTYINVVVCSKFVC